MVGVGGALGPNMGGDRDTVPAGDAAGGSGEASCPQARPQTRVGDAGKRWVNVPKVPEVPRWG